MSDSHRDCIESEMRAEEFFNRQIESRDRTIAELGASNASLIRRVADLESQLAEAESRAERAEREWQIADHRMTDMLKVVEADLAHAVDAYDAAGKGETDERFSEAITETERQISAVSKIPGPMFGEEPPPRPCDYCGYIGPHSSRCTYAEDKRRDDADSRAGQAGGED